MATRDDCVRAAVEAGASAEDAERLVDDISGEQGRLAASGQVDDISRRVADKIMADAEAARRKAKAERRMTALNIVTHDRIQTFLGEVKADGGDVVDAMEALLVGSSKNFAGSRSSASRLSSSLKALWGGSMANELERVGAVSLLKKDRNFSNIVMKEMIEPESTGDGLARQTADIFSRFLEHARLQLNDYGADIGKLDHYAPQSHDSIRMRRVGEAEWARFMSDKLDWERTFPGLPAEERLSELGEVYQNIVTGQRLDSEPKARSAFTPPRNVATSLGKERVLHFRDAAAAIEYNENFGSSNLVQAVIGKMEVYARRLALMETFGPNPEAMIRGFLDREIKEARNAHSDPKRILAAWQDDRRGRLAHYYRALSGEMGTPENLTSARIASASRAVMSMAKLGGAFLSSFTDVGIKASAARHAGEGWLEAWHTGLEMRFERFQGEEKRELGRRLGVYTQGLLGELYRHFDVNDALSGKMTRAMNSFFKLSGLTGWTEGHRAAYTFHLSNRLAREALSVGADGIQPDFAVVLRKNGLLDRWDLLKRMTEDVDGEAYVIPENAYRLTDSEMEPFLPEHLQKIPPKKDREKWEAARAAELDRQRGRLAQDVMGYFADETGYAVLEPDAKTRAAMYGSTRPGSVAGEMLRFAWQFKSFPVTYWQRILGEGRWNRASKTPLGGYASWHDSRRFTEDIPGFVHFALASTALGYVSMTSKDLSKGRTPRDIRANPLEVTLAAVMQGGGLGLLGDFFLGTADRFGNQLASNLVGPVPSELTNLGVLTGQLARGEFGDAGETAVRFTMNNMPFVNLWYTRMATDYLVNYHLREMMSPGTLARSERKMKEEMNQTYFNFGGIDLTPSHVIRRGGGFR